MTDAEKEIIQAFAEVFRLDAMNTNLMNLHAAQARRVGQAKEGRTHGG